MHTEIGASKAEVVPYESEERLQWLASIVESSDVAIIGKKLDGVITSWNKGAERMFGYTAKEAIGKSISILIPPERHAEECGIIERIGRGDRVEHYETVRVCKDGRTIVVLLTISPVKNAQGKIIGASKIATDITEQRRLEEERKRAELRLAHMAHHDGLTDLPNCEFLRERLDKELNYLRRGQQLAVLCIDLHDLTSINETLGHFAGDKLLKATADRLRNCLGDDGFIARLGGDQFAIIQTTLQKPTDATLLAERLRDEMIGATFELNGHSILADISIGIAFAPDDGIDADQLLKNVVIALDGAKSEGRGSCRHFEPQMDARIRTRRALEDDLRKALANGQLELHYQPIINLQANKISGCEALLRWHHPTRGMVSPSEFVPIAEDTGLMAPIGEWVLRQACTDAAAWPGKIKIAVNVSPLQIKSEKWTHTVASALNDSGLAPHRLELEITESTLMQDSPEILTALHRLRDLGVRIVMDDFGTGYSSLSYLLRFPFDKIKIDHSFVDNLSGSKTSQKIVHAVVSLAKGLDMITTAEGVETEAQLEAIRAIGCTEMQGYLHSPPRPAEEISRLLWSRTESAA